MTSQQWQQIEELFSEAVERPPAERSQFLDEACHGNGAVRAEVEYLLACDAQAGSFIEDSALPVAAQLLEHDDDAIGEHVGVYKIVREIGRGGMGTVYVAVRDDDEYQKEVAIKLIKRGMDTELVLRRFRNERQILAHLNHANIAKLHDGGTTKDGRPYFVMEYIEGMPITDYCAQHQLSIGERLKLFQTVCSAVEHAHRNLIVHRDLKPANILVTADGTPKLLDFGIAKLLNAELTEETVNLTVTMLRVMTPDYASPEQVLGLPITTTTDVYSLGVLLYELLTGARPYRLRGRTVEEITRAITEQEPAKPSARIAEFTVRRSDANGPTTDSRFPLVNPKFIRGDLDNIVAMAMRKHPDRRYKSVEQMSEDIHRHLEGLPIIARPDSLVYRTGKFVSRNKLGVAAGGFIALILIAGVVATSLEARAARQQRARAEAEKAKAEQRFNDVRRLAHAVLFDYHDAIADLPGSTAVRQRLVHDALDYLDSLSSESTNNAGLMQELAAAYLKIGDVQGKPYQGNLGDTAGALDSYRKAAAVLDRLSAIAPNDTRTRVSLSDTYDRIGSVSTRMYDWPHAIDSHRKALQLREDLLAADPTNDEYQRLVAASSTALADDLNYRLESSAALALYGKALKIRETLVAKDPNNLPAQRDLGRAYQRMGAIFESYGYVLSSTLVDPKDLEECYRRALENYRKSLEVATLLSHYDSTNATYRHMQADSIIETANMTAKSGDTGASLKLFPEAIRILQELSAADTNNAEAHLDLLFAYRDFGYSQSLAGRNSEAIRNYRHAIEIGQELQARDRNNKEAVSALSSCYTYLAQTLTNTGALGEAVTIHRKSLEDNTRAWEQPQAGSLIVLAQALVRTHETNEALRLTTRALALQKEIADKEQSVDALQTYAGFLLTCEPASLRDPKTAVTYLERANELSSNKRVDVLAPLAAAQYLTGDQSNALVSIRTALNLLSFRASKDDDITLNQILQATVTKFYRK